MIKERPDQSRTRARIVFRVDGDNASIGWGHVGRCLQLGYALRDLGASNIVFAMHKPHQDVVDKVKGAGFSVFFMRGKRDQLGPEIMAPAKETPSILIRDCYDLDDHWTSEAKRRFNRVVVLEDLPNRPHEAADLRWYSSESAALVAHDQTHTDHGLDYPLIDPRFIENRRVRSYPHGSPLRVLLAFGSSDHLGHIPKLSEALFRWIPESWQIVTLGPQYDKLDHHSNCKQLGRLGAEKVCDVMKDMSLFIGAASSMALEAACQGLPIACLPAADNQIPFFHDLTRRQLTIGPDVGESAAYSTKEMSDYLDGLLQASTLHTVLERQSRKLCAHDQFKRPSEFAEKIIASV